MLISWASRFLGPSLSLDFTSESLDPRVTFARASAAGRWNSAGVFVQESANAPRFDYDPITKAIKGLLIEEQRTNKCTNRNANPVDLVGVTKTGDAASTLTLVNDAAALAAAGLSDVCSNGNVFKLDNSAGVSFAAVDITGFVGNVNQHTVSVFWRGTGSGRVQTTAVASTNRVLPAAYSRQSETITPSASTDRAYVRAEPGAVVYFILNQLEEGAFVTSPIVTAGAQVTRAADMATATNIAALLNPSEYTLFVEGAYAGAGSDVSPNNRAMASLSDGTASNRAFIYNQAGNVASFIFSGGASQALISAGGVAAAGTVFKAATSVAPNLFNFARGGVLGTQDTAGAVPPVTQLEIGRSIATSFACGHVRKIALYPRRVSNSELQALSTL